MQIKQKNITEFLLTQMYIAPHPPIYIYIYIYIYRGVGREGRLGVGGGGVAQYRVQYSI